MAIVIDNTKESATSGEWSNPGKSLYGPIMEEDNAKVLLNEAYLRVGENYEDSPSTALGYPHHVIRNGKLVIHKDGLQASWSRGSAEGNLNSKEINHIKKHYRELGLDMSSFKNNTEFGYFMEYKNFNCEIKTMKEDWLIEGYGSIFGNKDDGGDIVEKGAFKRTINNNLSRMKYLWQHDIHEPIGKFLEMNEDSNGLYFKTKISDTDTGRKMYTLAKDGVIDENSIGYNTVKSIYDKIKDARRIQEARVWEISAVTFALNEKARNTNVKSFDFLLDEIKSGNLLKNASKDKIINAIEALTALINADDSSLDTHQINDSQKQSIISDISNIDIIDKPKQFDNFCEELLNLLKN